MAATRWPRSGSTKWPSCLPQRKNDAASTLAWNGLLDLATRLFMKLFVAGHNGMVGSAVMRRFGSETGVEFVVRSRKDLDLTDQAKVVEFFAREKPDAAVIGAAKVGGIHANSTYPADFIY